MRTAQLCTAVLVLLATGCGADEQAQGLGDSLRSGKSNGDPADVAGQGGWSNLSDTLAAELPLDCVRGGGSVGMIEVVFDCGSITVYSCKDLSNVVIEFEDGTRQRFEGLSGQVGMFSGTGSHSGQRIVGSWIKAGNNKSGDGPGYGERVDAPEGEGAGDCPPPEQGGSGGTSGSCGSDDPDNVCGGAGLGGGGAGGMGGTGGTSGSCGSDDPDNVCGGGGLGGAGNGGVPICPEGDPNCNVD